MLPKKIVIYFKKNAIYPKRLFAILIKAVSGCESMLSPNQASPAKNILLLWDKTILNTCYLFCFETKPFKTLVICSVIRQNHLKHKFVIWWIPPGFYRAQPAKGAIRILHL